MNHLSHAEQHSCLRIFKDVAKTFRLHLLIHFYDGTNWSWDATSERVQSLLSALLRVPRFRLQSDGSMYMTNKSLDYEFTFSLGNKTTEPAIKVIRKKTSINEEIVYYELKNEADINYFLVENELRAAKVEPARARVRHFLIEELKLPTRLEGLYIDFLGHDEWVYINRRLAYNKPVEEYSCTFLEEHYDFDTIEECEAFLIKSYRDFYYKNRLRYLTGDYVAKKKWG
jgi:hypothetical protein